MGTQRSFWKIYWGGWAIMVAYFVAWDTVFGHAPFLLTLLVDGLQKGVVAGLSLIVIRVARRYPLEGFEWGQWRIWGGQAALCVLVATIGLAVASFIWAGAESQMLGGSFHLQKAIQAIPYFYRDHFHWVLLLELCLAGVTHFLSLQQRLRQREVQAARLETSLLDAQHQALRMQLQPHFLFNTLNSLSSLVHTDSDAADRMIGRLGSFLRMTLERAPEAVQSLRSEMDFIEAYLAIEQIRFRNRLRTFLEAPADLQALKVPSFILQPLVENALKHGLSDKTEGGLLVVRALKQDANLLLQVQDNGMGFQEGRGGIGLTNIRSRLNLLYRGEALLEIRRPVEGGTCMEIRIPLAECGA